jgi:O-antigen/teichoic acid export membrane protein
MTTGAAARGLRRQLRELAGHALTYGAADVFTNALSFLLLPLFSRLLSAEDYGVLGVLQLLASLTKVLFRLGLDGAFLRVHYDQADAAAQRRLAGTVALFAAAVGSLLFALVVLSSPWLLRLLFSHARPPALWVVLVAADTWLGTFAFVPQALLRIAGHSRAFAGFSMLRHAVNLALKVTLLVAGWGVAGVLVSDLVATAVFSGALVPTLWRGSTLAFDRAGLREVLAFGLPRVPHGLLLQAQNLVDRPLLEAHVPLAQVGLYQVGYTLGSAVKFALSAFEPAWQPFVYAQIKRPDAQTTLARVVTYVCAAFVLLGLGLALFARELVHIMTAPALHAAWPVVPIVTLAYVLHGVFLLTSIGIGIEKKARYYPLVTLASAGTNVVANLVLLPRFGMLGAAWATLASYALMALLGFVLSRRLYPLPFEYGRLARVVLAAAAVYAASFLAPAALLPALAVKAVLLVLFPALVLGSGAISAEERAWLGRRWRALSSRGR